MFQLEEHLRDWSQRFSESEAMRGADIEELAGHLRDSMADLTANGLDEQEAFFIATFRLGEPATLCREFRKVNNHLVWQQRLLWMVAGCLVFELVRLLVATVASLGQICLLFAGSDQSTVISLVPLGVSVCCWTLLASWLFGWSKHHHSLCARSRRISTHSNSVGGHHARRSGACHRRGSARR